MCNSGKSAPSIFKEYLSSAFPQGSKSVLDQNWVGGESIVRKWNYTIFLGRKCQIFAGHVDTKIFKRDIFIVLWQYVSCKIVLDWLKPFWKSAPHFLVVLVNTANLLHRGHFSDTWSLRVTSFTQKKSSINYVGLFWRFVDPLPSPWWD